MRRAQIVYVTYLILFMIYTPYWYSWRALCAFLFSFHFYVSAECITRLLYTYPANMFMIKVVLLNLLNDSMGAGLSGSGRS